MEDVIVQFSDEEVVPYLVAALSSPMRSIRYWTSQIATNFPNPALIDPLAELLKTDLDEGVRFFAATALETIDDARVYPIFKEAVVQEPSDSVRALLEDAIADMEDRSK